MSEQYSEAQRRDWKPKANPWLIAVSVTLAAFMELLDTTIVNVSLPHIAGSMAASQDEATWTLTSYLLANSIILPISGFFERAFGRKRFFLICITMFTVCSVLCGLAQSLPQLIVFRLLQGMFGGGLQPSQQSIILDTFEPSQRGKAFGLVALATIVAPILGPSLGGVITDNFSWRWIFLINVPFGLLAFFSVTRFVEDPPWREEERKRTPLHVDYIGLSLIALGFGSLQVLLDRGEDDDWLSSGFIRTLAVTATIGLVGAVYWLSYARRPIVSLRCFTDRNYVIGFVCISATAFMLYSSGVLLPQLAQQDYGYTATLAGYMLTPGAAVLIFFIPLMTRIMPYVQARYIIATGFSMLAVAFFYCHHITPDTDFKTLVLMRGMQTLGIGCLFAPINSLAYYSLPKEQNADAASLLVMIRNVTGSVGISVATSLVTSRSQVRMAYLSEKVTNFSQPYLEALARLTRILTGLGQPTAMAQTAATGRLYRTLIAQASILGYMDVFAFCSILALAVIPLTFLFSPIKAGARQGE
jgi:DHA2 family multidrug resistance protein